MAQAYQTRRGLRSRATLAEPAGDAAGRDGLLEYLFFVVFALYLVPWLLSEIREHEHAGAILVVNLTTGWTGVGWLGALWWAGADLLPAHRRARVLALVPDPPGAAEAREARRARRLRVGVATVLGAAAVAVAFAPAPPVAAAARSERVARERVSLHAEPDLRAATVGALPRGCSVAVMEEHGDWRRVWRTADCPAGAAGRASGWLRGPATLPQAAR
jgi:hypothetical protein